MIDVPSTELTISQLVHPNVFLNQLLIDPIEWLTSLPTHLYLFPMVRQSGELSKRLFLCKKYFFSMDHCVGTTRCMCWWCISNYFIFLLSQKVFGSSTIPYLVSDRFFGIKTIFSLPREKILSQELREKIGSCFWQKLMRPVRPSGLFHLWANYLQIQKRSEGSCLPLIKGSLCRRKWTILVSLLLLG